VNDATGQRWALVDRLAAAGITDPQVLAAMRRVPRERFVPAELAEVAYADEPLPIGADQTISAPYLVALMTQALRLQPTSRVLEIGTGSGYAAAVLAHCCHSVVTIERHLGLAETARQTLAELGHRNVDVRVADGSRGAPDRAPFDGIVVTAMADEAPPPALLGQLAPHGTLVCPVSGRLIQVRDGEWEVLGTVAFVPLIEDDACMDTDDEYVLVPALVGLQVGDAHALALDSRVVTVNEDPDTPPPLSGTVAAQYPLGGTRVRPGDAVQIRVEHGGGGGGGSRTPDVPDPLDPAGGKQLDPA